MTGPWLWNFGLPAWVPVVCRVAVLRRRAEVPRGTWFRVLGPMYASDRRPWDAVLEILKGPAEDREDQES